MSESSRNELIDAYFEAADTDDPSVVADRLTEDFVYDSTSGTLDGFSGLETYLREMRGFSDTEHTVTRRIHGDEASAAEGTVTGKLAGESVETNFCNVFEFDERDERIARVGVYVNDS